MSHPDYVTRYVLTAIGYRDGLRELVDPMQGRFTYATREEAQVQLNARLLANPPGRIRAIWGIGDDAKVRECECYADSFDPIGRYFDER